MPWSRSSAASPLPGLGVAGGFKFMVEDRGGLGVDDLQRQTDDLVRKLQAEAGHEQRRPRSSAPTRRSSSWTSTGPRSPRWASRWTTSIRRSTCTSARSTSTASTSSAATGRSPSRPTAKFRDRVEDINLLRRSATTRARWSRWARWSTPREIGGPIAITRYNLYTAAAVNGNVQPDVSTGDAIDTIDAAGRRERCRCP